jgi:NADH-quinone oxidoreductase subunit L
MGAPLFSGYLSKEGLLGASLGWATVQSDLLGNAFAFLVPFLAFVTVGLTAFYVVRQILLVFFGSSRLEAHLKLDGQLSIPKLGGAMRWPLLILATLSIGFAFSANPFSPAEAWVLRGLTTLPNLAPLPAGAPDAVTFLEATVRQAEALHLWVTALSIGAMLTGGGAAYWWLRGGARPRLHQRGLPLLTALAREQFYLNRLYDSLLAPAGLAIGQAATWLDRQLVDRLVHGLARLTGGWRQSGADGSVSSLVSWVDRRLVDATVHGIANSILALGKGPAALQTGRVQTYLWLSVLVLGGLVALFIWLL